MNSMQAELLTLEQPAKLNRLLLGSVTMRYVLRRMYPTIPVLAFIGFTLAEMAIGKLWLMGEPITWQVFARIVIAFIILVCVVAFFGLAGERLSKRRVTIEPGYFRVRIRGKRFVLKWSMIKALEITKTAENQCWKLNVVWKNPRGAKLVNSLGVFDKDQILQIRDAVSASEELAAFPIVETENPTQPRRVQLLPISLLMISCWLLIHSLPLIVIAVSEHSEKREHKYPPLEQTHPEFVRWLARNFQTTRELDRAFLGAGLALGCLALVSGAVAFKMDVFDPVDRGR